MSTTSTVPESFKTSGKTERDTLHYIRSVRHRQRLLDEKMSTMLNASLQQQRQILDKLHNKFYFQPLKIAPTIQDFNSLRELVHDFNKRNVGADNPLTWGDNGKYSRVESVNSLKSWLLTAAAVELRINPSYYEDFMVVNIGGNLITFGEDYKDGYHPSAFWIPARKYACTPSQDWSHPCMKENDPRLQFVDPNTGKAWCTSCIETRKRKL